MTGHHRVAVAGAGFAAGGWLVHPLLTIAGVVTLVGVGVLWRQRRSASAGLVGRWSRRSRRNDGVASAWSILRVSSSWAMRRRARILRPSLAELSWWRRWRTPIRELATPLARVGWQRVWSPVEDVTLRVGGPRTGKTGELCCRILDAPGAVIATSTRTDLVTVTEPLRARRGPVLVFNPSGVGGLASTITFNPLSGCQDPTTATARAADLLSATAREPVGEGEHWLALARQSLAPLLHAAALGDGTMGDIRAWVADPHRAEPDVHRLLSRSPQRVFDADAQQFFETGERTRSSICATIMPCLAWLADPKAAAAAHHGEFNVAELLECRGTVYLLGAEEAHTAPLVTALTGHIAREARRIAGRQPCGRLDPPLTMVLDEAALICPIPLDKWTADMGGRNVTLHVAAQSRAQLRKGWGADGAAAILNNAATLLIFGGGRDPDDLAAYSTLSGERYEPAHTRNDTGAVTSVSDHRVPVLSAAQIAQLPTRHAVIIRRGMPPAIGRPQMAWQRWDVRAHRWGARWKTATTWAAARLPQRTTGASKSPQPRLRVVPPPPERDAA